MVLIIIQVQILMVRITTMCTSIDDIDWTGMPEEAVEFSLANDVFTLTWYDADIQFWACSIGCWKKDHCPDYRIKYKVADYHPSMKENEQVFVPVIGEPCTAVVDAVFGELPIVVTPLYIGPKLVVVETSGRHDTYPVEHIMFFPLDDKHSDWVKAALLIVQEKKQGPTSVMDRTVLCTVYTAMKEGRLSLP